MTDESESLGLGRTEAATAARALRRQGYDVRVAGSGLSGAVLKCSPKQGPGTLYAWSAADAEAMCRQGLVLALEEDEPVTPTTAAGGQ